NATRRIERPLAFPEHERLTLADGDWRLENRVLVGDDPQLAVLERDDDVQITVALRRFVRVHRYDAVAARAPATLDRHGRCFVVSGDPGLGIAGCAALFD